MTPLDNNWLNNWWVETNGTGTDACSTCRPPTICAWHRAHLEDLEAHIDKLVEKARQETHALYPDKGEYITKAEAERMVLKARIDEIGSFAGYEDGDWYGMIRIPMQRFVERIAELRSDDSNRKSVTTATPKEKL